MSICQDCAYWNEYGTFGVSEDQEESYRRNREETLRREFGGCKVTLVHGCGPDCPDHGVAAYDGDYERWQEASAETWFSWSPCEACGALAGQREHATAFIGAEVVTS